MSTPISCPSCRSVIPVPVGFAEPVIRCGICWTAVPFAAPAEERPTAPVRAKPLPAKPSAPMAAAIPAGATPDMMKLEAHLAAVEEKLRPTPVAPRRAKAITATPSTAIIVPPPAASPVLDAEPVPSKSRRSRNDDSSTKTKYGKRRARDDDDDDDDNPTRRPARTGTLVAALIGAGFVLIVMAIGGFFLVKSAFGDKPDAAQADANQPIAQPNNQPVNPLPEFNVPRGNNGDRNRVPGKNWAGPNGGEADVAPAACHDRPVRCGRRNTA